MMNLYSGTTDPFSHRCRIVLFEKGMDFEVIDVDLYNKPEDIAIINPYNRVPVLVDRDLVLYEANIINEYIDERFPHPQLMPPDPIMRARARQLLHTFEQELFTHLEALEAARQMCPETVVVMVTGCADRAFVTQAASLGAKGYILKPVEEDKLIEAIRQFLPK